ncbi:GIY-YIG nuclease family protein [Synechocystis salina]|uniref:GIY-YIG nuclease family protein n=1 Tax=Synechocystis salina TaxID=945780 RepID=UPI001D14CD26|nr:GIY-YIG nuclease family protein [Synechocystis salina]
MVVAPRKYAYNFLYTSTYGLTMPALNVYVTDDLKRRMAKVDANWSDICRKAIEGELSRRENKGLGSLNIEDVKEWITEELDPFSEHNSVVIKPYLHTTGKVSSEVKILSQFYEEIISEVKKYYLNSIKGNFSLLLENKHQVDLLFPGREWISGTLGLRFSLLLNTPKEEITDEVIDGEFLETSNFIPLLESGLTKVKMEINQNNKSNEITKYIDIDPEIKNYQQKEFETPELPSEIYSIFRKAWKNLYDQQYCDPPKPLTATKLKQLWQEWYYPEAWQDSENWLDKWQNRYRSKKYVYEWENIVASFMYALDGQEFDPSFSELPEELDSWNSSDFLFLSFIEYISKFIYDGEFLELTEINPTELSALPIEERDELPEQPGIYFVLNRDDTIEYIGMSANLQKRWYSHHRQSDFDLIEDGKIAFITSLPKHYLQEIESVLIKSFVPKLNIKLKPKV